MFENISEIILKVTRDCNLRCQYCYIKDKDKYKNERMSSAVFKKLIDRIVYDKKKNPLNNLREKIQIIFHGGEPTLLGVETLTEFITYARQQLPGVTFGFQTNLTKIDENWLLFFKENNIVPGVSVDGLKQNDNDLRIKGFSLYEKLELLKNRGVGYGPLMVITNNNVMSYYENVLAIIKHSGNRYIKVNYAENTYTDKAESPEATWEQLYKHVFIPTLAHFISKIEFIEENFMFLIDKFVKNYVFEEIFFKDYLCHGHCSLKFCAGGNNLVEVDPEGNVCFCGRWSDVNDLNFLGNFQEKGDFFGLKSFSRVLNVQLEKIKDIREKGCDFCFAQDICSYGCIAFAYDKYNGNVKIREDLVCLYVKKIKENLLKNKYLIIYRYVQFNKWEIVNHDGFIYLNIPLWDGRYQYRKKIDEFMEWATYNDKIYLKIPAKLIEI